MTRTQMLKKSSPDTALLGFAGDIMIGRLVNDHLKHYPPEYPWGDLLPLLQATDTNIGNLETTLTSSTDAVPKVFNFRSDPKNVEVLQRGGFDYVNIANNHILDYSFSGFQETLNTLKAAGIAYVGAGMDDTGAAAPLIFEKRGVTFGMLGCTDNEPDWKATPTKAGTRYLKIGDIDAIAPNIKKLRTQVDIVILSIHWGPNMRERPTQAFIDFAHQLIDLGVDILHGHSAHIFQGVECHKGGLILYDTGDFVDDYYVDPELHNDRSFFFGVEVSKKGFERLTMIPTKIGTFQVNRAVNPDKKESLERMQLLSRELGTQVEIEGDVATVCSPKN